MTPPRTFRIDSPFMEGEDIRGWQATLNRKLRSWDVALTVAEDGVYGIATRSVSKMVCFGLGFTHDQLDNGITPWIRDLTRNPGKRPVAMRGRASERSRFRANLRRKFRDRDVAAPISQIIASSWGWVPGVHDGIDLICGPHAPIFALCDARVVDVRPSGWWGKAPTGDVWKGDGIIQLESLTDAGPFEKGLHIGYGHAEGADVKVGDVVQAGDRIGEAGLAVAWHIHLMVNGGGHLRGIGDRDPRPYLDFAIESA